MAVTLHQLFTAPSAPSGCTLALERVVSSNAIASVMAAAIKRPERYRLSAGCSDFLRRQSAQAPFSASEVVVRQLDAIARSACHQRSVASKP